MISASRAGGSPSSARRALISALKSGMLNSGDAVDRLDELDPAMALLRQHPFARRRKAIIAAAKLPGFFSPPTADPVQFFLTIEQGVQRSDVESEGATRGEFVKRAYLVS